MNVNISISIARLKECRVEAVPSFSAVATVAHHGQPRSTKGSGRSPAAAVVDHPEVVLEPESQDRFPWSMGSKSVHEYPTVEVRVICCVKEVWYVFISNMYVYIYIYINRRIYIYK